MGCLLYGRLAEVNLDREKQPLLTLSRLPNVTYSID
jgi:hypothetical protein